ncbi:DUF3885 domain-containing protein [Metabacillus indicus]|uniref:DUF3885 domain-containing protein n=1 Tax=Metabacillus indicus TaxID=246786 RepID=UPI002A00689D|nr:DUF3885 domain-containing protein [Metabacillus indicus]MDX8289106.1 DUF3885 domain-containing protein [Metabacillus indicus]
MKDYLSRFLHDHFNILKLEPPLFYSSPYGIRFEIAIPWMEHEDNRNLRQIEKRSTGIFNQVFKARDDMLLITDFHCKKNDQFLQKRPAKVYQKYIKNKKLRLSLQHKIIPNAFSEEEMVTHRFILPCKKNDIRYEALLAAISYEDFRHPTNLLKGFPRNGIDIYFINTTRKMIYHLYDDRGCDVIASRKEDLLPLYHDFNEWNLDYDREEIDGVFG